MELLRLSRAFDNTHLIYMSTNESFRQTVPENDFVLIPEVSRWNKLKVVFSFFKMMVIIGKLKPDVIITTGAAPGVLALLVGKLLGAKTIWVESMCHAAEISLSGKIVSVFASTVYTQYAHLASRKFIYSGNIL